MAKYEGDARRGFLRDGRAPIPASPLTSKVMSANKGIATKPEIKVRKSLSDAGIRGYRVNWKKAPGTPDIAFPGRKLAIFINGCFWHRCPKCQPNSPKTNIVFWTKKFEGNEARDKNKKEALDQLGWRVIVVWECEVKNDMDGIISAIKKNF